MTGIPFNNLDEKMKFDKCTIPQAVFVTLNPDDETFEQIVERQEKFLKLPEPIKDKLVSSETSEKIKAIGAHYRLELLQMAPIARIIRSYYFGEVKEEDFAKVISEESKISLEDAQNIARYIIDRIIKKDASAPLATPTVKMTISQAMEKYSEIKGQILTSAPIEIEGQMARPTIQNWIKDYFNAVGAGNRDIMKRSSFLYHSKNVKNLTTADRQKLSNILKSVDEGFLLKVDVLKKEIVFDNTPAINKTSQGIGIDMGKKTERPMQLPTMLKSKDGEVKHLDNVTNAAKKEVIKADLNNNTNRISHIQGNSWDLKSSHFIKRDEFDTKVENKDNQDNIKFSSPQQLPVEKEHNLVKPDFGDREPSGGKSLKNFFGRIGPME